MFTNLLRCLPLICLEADGAATSGGASTEGSTAGGKKADEEGQKGNSETVTLTKEELDKKLQSFSDQRVTDAIKTHSAKLEAEFQKKIADAVAEAMKKAEEKAKMSEKEREEAARIEREEALKERESKIKEQERLILAGDLLSAAGIDLGMREFITSADEEGMKAQIQKLNGEIDKRVEKKLEERLKETGKETIPPADGKGAVGIDAELNALLAIDNPTNVQLKRMDELAKQLKAKTA
ncbi:MAG: DUF4355 domain-containing protein [Mesotoga sp.]|nr:DUF4355 domain-containing protein [Mesotoga sp.]